MSANNKTCYRTLASVNINQIFHAFLFNIRNYLPGISNIQRREAELNIVLPRVDNCDNKLPVRRHFDGKNLVVYFF